MNRSFLRGVLAGALLLLAAPAAAATTVPTDAYTAGYVAAILEREFKVAEPKIEVQDGWVKVYLKQATGPTRDKMVTVLSNLPGVRGVEVVEAGTQAVPPVAEAPSERPPPERAAEPAPIVTAAAPPADDLEFLPSGELFEPLMADPRWPHFSATYQRFFGDEEIGNAGAVSFGETIGLLRGPAPFEGQWQLDFQAAVFALFDLNAESKDLINADYWVGLPVSYRKGRFSAVARLFHQSSHLGDEFILRSRLDRINLSYESIDLKASYELGDGLRFYGGGGYLFHEEPDLKPWSTQAGVEYYAPFTYFDGLLRPVAGVDVQNRQETDWDADVSVRAGVQLESRKERSQRLQLLLEYFNGRNPNGQFYDRNLDYFGLGAHVYF